MKRQNIQTGNRPFSGKIRTALAGVLCAAMLAAAAYPAVPVWAVDDTGDIEPDGKCIVEVPEDAEFVDGEVLVVIKREYSGYGNVYTAEDFPEAEIESMEYVMMPPAPEQETLFNMSSFRQILLLRLTDKTREAVLEAVTALNQNELVWAAEPNYLVSIVDDVLVDNSDVTWSYDAQTKTLTVSGSSSGSIPDYPYEGEDKSIHDTPWKAYKDEAETIIVGEGLSIGDYAFDDFTALRTVVLQEGVDLSGEKMFPYREGKENITIKGKNLSEQEIYASRSGYRFEPVNDCLRGDLNGSGEYEASDALHILQMTVKLEEMKFAYTADADANGTVNAADALYVLKKVVKLI